ncbi:putative alpha-1,2-mannosidase [Herbihabitans rhizosphaerae]|uniref:Putative alpha-1,2-mannosidase n=1 Tax=Herbihabitans rhizosphaerae TaxID=1872711 RepID=A0A4V2ESW5_9PSEU|nr:GH92 family glycosyl hydrolase [Herbihabitans rhizosphaerae]RZS38993.1 putative alpha-1,2-mannosidase [Herbihabitans rhizosphaerae]
MTDSIVPRGVRRATRGLFAAVLAAATLIPVSGAVSAQEAAAEDLAKWVNPYIGTKPGGADHGTGGGAGNTFPGADVPFGMVQWSPDTVTHQHGGYFYDDNRIKGFSLTHLSGAGCSTYQDVPIMPFPGTVTTSPATDPNRYVSTFSHDKEKITPGYYGVDLDSGVKTELTATQRTGMGRFAFPADKPKTMLVNTSGSIAGADDAETVIGRDTISGWVTSGRFCGVDHRYRVYFHAQFDRPFESIGTWKDGSVDHGKSAERGGSPPDVDLKKVNAPKTRQDQAVAGRSTRAGKPDDTTVSGPGTGAFVSFDRPDVGVRVGLSFVSMDGAKGNLRAENRGSSFDEITRDARAAWNARLNRIRVKGGTDAQRTTFYTALYHSLLQPNVFSDADGRYIGFDGRVHDAGRGHAVYSNLSGWDVYRSEMQLIALIAPREASDISRSMIAFAEQGGSWDRWTVANSYTGVMVGDPYHAMVASSYAFGAKDFDAAKALRLMVKGATEPTQGYQERPGIEEYLAKGYVPMGTKDVWGPAATTLEYNSADFAIADLAGRLGDQSTVDEFMRRAQFWQNLYNPGSGYLHPRNADGSFIEPFNPASGEGWVEGNGAQYNWMVPFNSRGLINAMGGDTETIKRLDHYFTELNAGPQRPYAFMGNEPSMPAPWLYSYAGAPYKTQSIARRVTNELFTPTEKGLVGNDDLGQMSSWYVWAAMGMFPYLPGRAELMLNSPLFEEVTISRPNGVRMTIKAPGASATVPYVTGLTVNGTASTKPWLPESFVERGGTVEFRMSATPDPVWGSAPEDRPPSFRAGEIGQRGYVDPGRLVIPAGGQDTANVGAQDLSGSGATIKWSAQPPAGFTVEPAGGEVVVPPGQRASVPVTVKVAPGTAETTYRIPVTFSTADGKPLQGGVLQVLVAQPGSLRAAFNNVGISPDDNPAIANFDNVGWSYSSDALAGAGVRPGQTVTVDGLAHLWPAIPVGDPDNAVAAGQRVDLPGTPATATKLALLGSASNGKSTGTLVIRYTDGSTQEVPIGFSDWTLGGGSDQPSFDNRIAASTPYRNATSGEPQEIVTHVFATAPVPLQAGKQLAGVTLPSTVEGGGLHVFAITAG